MNALTAETAYQLVRGNTSRTASTLAAIAQGDAPPPELDVAKTPRSGTSLTHRLLLLMSGPNVNTPGWISAAARVRSNAEPMLNFWAFKLFGDGSTIRCTIERVVDATDSTGAVAETRKLPLSELGLAPLDSVYGVEAANTTAQPGMTLSEIEQQVLYHSKRKTGGFDLAATLRLQHARPTDLAAGEITLFDALEQARAVRRLLGVARGADPEDLNPPERTGQGDIDLVELDARVVRAENALDAAHKALQNLIARITTTTTAEMLRPALLKLGAFGIELSVPVNAAGEDADAKAALVQQGQALLKLSGPRLDQGALLRAEPVATDQRGRRAQLTARMPRSSATTSSSCRASRSIVRPRPNSQVLSRSQDGGARRRPAGGQYLVRPLLTRTRRRLALRRLPAARGSAQRGGAAQPERRAAAIRERGTVGRAVARGWGSDPPSKLSLVIHTIGTINPTLFTTGLLVDEWVEVVPNTRETTALAFQFDMPDACAPQSVLIAVPPVPGQDWSAEILRRVLMETLDLAKLRAVDTASLGAAARASARTLFRVQHRGPRHLDRLRDGHPLTGSQHIMPQLFIDITFPAPVPPVDRTFLLRGNISWSAAPTWKNISKNVTVQFGPGGQLVAAAVHQRQQLAVHR